MCSCDHIFHAATMIGGLNLGAPSAANVDPKKTFEDLGARYKIDVKITKRMSDDLQLTTLQEFGKLPVGSLDDLLVKPASLGTTAPVNLARLLIAHEKVCDAVRFAEVIDLEVAESDLDKMLPESELKSLRDRFHGRYKMTFSPEDDAPDKLVSRLSKELAKRDLTLKDIWSVQSLSARQKATKMRTEVAPGLTWAEDDVEFHGYRSATAYLNLLQTYMIGLSKAGVLKLDTPVDPEVMGTPTIKVVAVPLDTALRYVSRARRVVETIISNNRLSWLEATHTQEAEMWIYKYKNSESPLGKIIEEVMVERSIFWTPPESITIKSQLAAKGQGRGKGAGKSKPRFNSGKGKGKREIRSSPQFKQRDDDVQVRSNKRWLKQLYNGDWLCAEFQKNKCPNKNGCSKGKHLCALEVKPGVACGRNHPATQCQLAWS